MADAPERKLTTILSADAVGYSRLMGEDEWGTLELLRSSKETFAAEIARYRGRIVNTAGDSALAEFSSVVNAVECAVRVQRGLAERNASLPPDRRMHFRIGINLGDVLVEGDDLFGEGVNIAARLQALAEPGGILISGTVFDQVRNKLTVGFDFLGQQEVKNIAEAVPAWRVLLDGVKSEAAASRRESEAAATLQASTGKLADRTSGTPARHQRVPRGVTRIGAMAAVLVAVFLAINVLTSSNRLWFQWPSLSILTIAAVLMIWRWGK